MEIVGPRLVLRDVAPVDVDALRTIHADPGVARWWGPPDPGWPLEEDDPGLVVLTMWRDDEIAGFIQFWEEADARFRYAAIDLFVAPAHQRQGIGSEALRILVDHLVQERGHHRITIDPALDNAGAIACYAGVGFAPIGVMRAYERDPTTGDWRDALLMEQVRLDTRPAGPPAEVTLRAAIDADLDDILAAEGAEGARPFVRQDT